MSDAVVLVVSEEDGTISLARGGTLTRGLEPAGGAPVEDLGRQLGARVEDLDVGCAEQASLRIMARIIRRSRGVSVSSQAGKSSRNCT